MITEINLSLAFIPTAKEHWDFSWEVIKKNFIKKEKDETT